jgi:hypothetical protein
MSMFRWILGGVIGGGIGVLVWVLVGYYSHAEVGWIAWGIGFLAGVGVRYAAYLGQQEESALHGILAAVIAAGCIICAKFLVFSLLTNQAATSSVDDELMISHFADKIIEEKKARGERITLPHGKSLDEAESEKDYPPLIWKQAEQQWNKIGAEERENLKKTLQAMVANAVEAGAGPDFSKAFTPWDLLWFGLAMITAYKIGVGTYGAGD